MLPRGPRMPALTAHTLRTDAPTLAEQTGKGKSGHVPWPVPTASEWLGRDLNPRCLVLDCMFWSPDSILFDMIMYFEISFKLSSSKH